MGSWFGSLDLAYKYTIVFGSLLAVTILAGFVKVFFDRRKLKKLAAQKDEEGSPREEQMELNRREKDEGDLFGIRAIEAGYFAGIPQSRPTSRAGSIIDGPTMSSSTLVGGAFNSPKFQSMASSVTSLPLAHTNDRNRDSDTLPSPPQRVSPPSLKLRPSEAELSGRINHNAGINMSLDVPPSPVHAHHSQRYSGSDSGESETHTLKSGHYSPVPLQVPVENNLRVSVVSADGAHKSHAASVNDPSPLSSPNPSGPPSPRHRPESYVPTMPDRAQGDDYWMTQGPAYHKPEPTQQTVPEQPGAPVVLLPRTYEPAHKRDASNSSSFYSQQRHSVAKSTHSRNFSLPRNSVAVASAQSKDTSQPPLPTATLAPTLSHGAASDPRFSEFYDAYFRNSRLNFGLQFDTSQQQGLGLTEPTKMEALAPEPSKPGMAL